MRMRAYTNVNIVIKYILGRDSVALLIKNARIVDKNKDFQGGDIYIRHGKIAEIDRELNYNCKTIDGGEDLVAMPSFIDMHVHFREPGYTHKEDLHTGSMAALKGGYTFVNLMGGTPIL